MEIPVELLLPPKAAARGNKGWGGFFQADDGLTAYVVDRVTRTEPDRLDECLDLILEDPSYHQMRQALMNQVPWELLLSTLDNSREPVTVPNVPTVVADRVVTARRVEHILLRCIARHIVLRDTATDRIPVTLPAPRPEHPAMNFDAMIPHPVRRVLLYQKFGEICGRALMSERIVSSALADALVERWLRGLWGMLGYMVHLGLADAAKVGLPERYRLVDVQEQFDEERSGFVAALEEVERSGKGYPQVYLSDEDDDDDDDDNEDVED